MHKEKSCVKLKMCLGDGTELETMAPQRLDPSVGLLRGRQINSPPHWHDFSCRTADTMLDHHCDLPSGRSTGRSGVSKVYVIRMGCGGGCFFHSCFCLVKPESNSFLLETPSAWWQDERDPLNLVSPSISQTNLIMEDFHDHTVTGWTVSSPTPNSFVEVLSLTISEGDYIWR